MKRAIVTTTINVPHNLTAYCDDIVKHEHDDVAVIVAGDRKTKSEAAAFCADLAACSGVNVIYFGVEEQNRFLAQVPEYGRFLPWDCIQRRNVALLKAYSEGAETIFTIDDDNFLHTPDYIGSHGKLGEMQTLQTFQSSSGWLDVCSFLKESRGRSFFHRGYSYNQRLAPRPEIKRQHVSGRIVVNAGLWLGDPDVDAVTRLAIAPDVVACDIDTNIALMRGTIAPFNSQNTALIRDVIPAYCMHVGIGRYDDIIPSYFVKRIADHLMDYLSFGMPLVRQERNAHDLWVDADKERVGYQLVDRIVEWLYEIDLKGRDYRSCMEELLPEFREKSLGAKGLSAEQTQFLAMIDQNYRAWLAVIDQIDASSYEWAEHSRAAAL